MSNYEATPLSASGSAAGPSAAENPQDTPCFRFQFQRPGRRWALGVGCGTGAGVGLLTASLASAQEQWFWAFKGGFGWLVALAVGIGLGTCGVLYLLARQPRAEPWLCLEPAGLAWGWGRTRAGEMPYDRVAAVIEHREPERLTLVPVEEGDGEGTAIQLGGGLFTPPVPAAEIRAAVLERIQRLPQGAERVVAVAEDSDRMAGEMEWEARRIARLDRWWSFGFVAVLGASLLLPRLVPALEEHATWMGLLLGVFILIVIVRFRKVQAPNGLRVDGIGTADPAFPKGSGELPEELENPLLPDS